MATWPRGRGAPGTTGRRLGERVAHVGQAVYASIPITKSASGPKGVTYCYGLASTGVVDRDQQIVDPDFMLREIKRFGDQQGPIRLGHDSRRPIGKAIDTDGLYVKSMIVDKQARKMLAHGILRAYSVGIANPVIKRDPRAPGGRVASGELIEVSLVDSPSNPQCGVQLVSKGADGLPHFTGKAFVAKGRGGYCLKCLNRMKEKHPKCRNCGAKNLFHVPKAGRPVKAKKIRRRQAKLAAWQNIDMLTKASGSRWPVYNTHQAITAMLIADCNSPDPGKREAAKIALANHR